MDDAVAGMYEPFAHWAKKHGLDAARSRFAGLDDGMLDELSAAYLAAMDAVQMGGPPIIAAAGLDDWYSGPDRDFGFWRSLEDEFRANGWPEDRIDSVDRSSTQVVAHTPRPTRPKWDSKGLVVGYVQSGKTTNFTSVIAKLADEDYDVVVVLSGIHNGLRRQTQQRLDQQLKETQPARVITLTDETKDFHIPAILPTAAISPNDGKFVLVVAKKNAAVLRRLIRWLDNARGAQALQQARCLVVDDEADQASVATGRINPLIRRLISLMPRCTYIGYTATPFANVFIDPKDDDLYPRDFILNLPRPDGYFGPEMIFGRNQVDSDDEVDDFDGYDMVRHVPEADLPKLRPVGRGAAEGFAPVMTDELKDSIRWFWLATAARRARGDSDHSTMLIHTSVKTSIHESYREPLKRLREDTLRELGADGADLSAWREQWDRETARVPAEEWGRIQNNFDEISGFLAAAVEETRIVLDNSRSEDRLDYSGDTPVVAVAVGGNTLSRGLTLEGLVTSFFVRSATTYDTLLQMGRWFGYRFGYEDLARIWMTPELERQFRHLALVEHEMRQDIDAYQLQNKTPLEIAVRIRTHPSMRITAKMGAAAPTHLSYAGRRMQTRYFQHRDNDWLEANRLAAERLISSASRASEREGVGSTVLYRNVPVADIKTFLSEYQVHSESPDMDPAMMIKFIDRELEKEKPLVEKWSVAVVNGTGEEVTLAGESLSGVIRSKLDTPPSSPDDFADIKTLMSKADMAIDMSISRAEASKLPEARLKAERQKDPLTKDRGLLVLYPIDKVSPADKPSRSDLDALDTVIGLGMIFPGEADESNQVRATHMAVDLTGVEERPDQSELNAVIEEDTEGIEPA